MQRRNGGTHDLVRTVFSASQTRRSPRGGKNSRKHSESGATYSRSSSTTRSRSCRSRTARRARREWASHATGQEAYGRQHQTDRHPPTRTPGAPQLSVPAPARIQGGSMAEVDKDGGTHRAIVRKRIGHAVGEWLGQRSRGDVQCHRGETRQRSGIFAPQPQTQASHNGSRGPRARRGLIAHIALRFGNSASWSAIRALVREPACGAQLVHSGRSAPR